MCKKLLFIFSLVLVLGLTANTPVAELVAYYPLDEGSGDIVHFFQGGSYPGGGVVLPVDEWKSIELSRRATDSKE
ncbi:MAG: hypothetical protein ACYS67_17835 [Planctomycetota bacterium]|jgi:hypothetical protein